MNKFLKLFIVCFFIISPPLLAGKGLLENGQFLDLSDICIVARSGGHNLTPGGTQRNGTSVEEVVDTYIAPHVEHLSKVRILDLSTNNMPPEVLSQFVTVLEQREFWSQFRSVELVLLSHNTITAETAPVLTRFLELYRQEQRSVGFPYINIVHTPSDKKDIKSIAQALKSGSQPLTEAPPLMSHLIFLQKNYVWHAENRVQVYRDMVRTNNLPSNWLAIHRGYYQSRVFNDVVRFRRNIRDLSFRETVRQSHERTRTSGEDPLSEQQLEELTRLVGQITLSPLPSSITDQ